MADDLKSRSAGTTDVFDSLEAPSPGSRLLNADLPTKGMRSCLGLVYAGGAGRRWSAGVLRYVWRIIGAVGVLRIG